MRARQSDSVHVAAGGLIIIEASMEGELWGPEAAVCGACAVGYIDHLYTDGCVLFND